MLLEKALTTKKRNLLPDNQFGIPEIRAYPINDKSHVEQAVRMFNHVEPEYEKELADNLIKAIKKFNLDIEVGDTNRFKKYFKECVIKKIGDVTMENKSLVNESKATKQAKDALSLAITLRKRDEQLIGKETAEQLEEVIVNSLTAAKNLMEFVFELLPDIDAHYNQDGGSFVKDFPDIALALTRCEMAATKLKVYESDKKLGSVIKEKVVEDSFEDVYEDPYESEYNSEV